MNEEIIYRTGVDTRPFQTGMRSLNRIAADAGKGIESSLASIGTRLGASLGIGAMVAGLGVAIKRAMDLADEIRGISEAAGVSGSFLQSGRLFADENGSSAEDFTKGLTKINEKIGDARRNVPEAVKLFQELGISIADSGGNARSTEEIYGDFADKLKSIENPSVRASVAAELLGEKLASKLVPALAQGSAALKEFSESNKGRILDEQDLAVLDAAKDKLTALKTLALTFTAKMLTPALNAFTGDEAAIAGFKAAADKGRAIAEKANALAANGGVPPKTQEQIDAVNKALEALAKKRNEIAFENSDTYTRMLRLQTEERRIKGEIAQSDKESVEGIKLQTQLEETQAKLRQQSKLVEKEIKEEKQKQADAAERAAQATQRQADAERNALNAVRDAENNLNRARSERAKFGSVEDLAKSLSPEARQANQVLEKERQAEWWRQRGNETMANVRFSEADKLRQNITGLTENARDPFKALEEQLAAAKETAEATKSINKKFGGTH